MRNSLFFTFLLLMMANHLFADSLLLTFEQLAQSSIEEAIPLTIQQLDQKKVRIRGFLYRTSDERLILASQPDLKSCCIGTKNNLRKQIILKGEVDFIKQQNVITLEGIFKIEPLYTQDGQLIQFYLLDQVKILTLPGNTFPWITLGGISLSLVFLYFLIAKNKMIKI